MFDQEVTRRVSVVLLLALSFGHSRQLVRQLSIYIYFLVILVVDENVLKCVCMLNNFGLNCLASSISSLIGYGPSASAGAGAVVGAAGDQRQQPSNLVS